MRSHTPTSSKSPFSINRKSQIGNTSSFISKQNSFINLNQRLQNACHLVKSRPMIQIEGNLIDASTVIKQKESMIFNMKTNSKKLEHEVYKQNQIINELQLQLEQRDDLINRLQAEKQSMGSAFAMIQCQTLQASNLNHSLKTQNISLKHDLLQKSQQLKSASNEIQELKFNLQIYNGLDPRLKQLQQLQDKLIEDNNLLKLNKDNYAYQLQLLTKQAREGVRLDVSILQSLLKSL